MIRRVAAQSKIELLLTLRRVESLFVTVALPVGILVFFTAVDILPLGHGRTVDLLVPGALALSVLSTGMVSLGISTGFERQWGVLKRVGATPLGRGGLLAAKIVSALALVVLQVVVIGAVGLALGWNPRGSPAIAVVVLSIGVAAFAGLGFLFAGTLRAETTIAVANGAFLLLMLLGGIIVPVTRLPGPLEAVARILPGEPLATSLRGALTTGDLNARSFGALIAWAVGACILAAARFRWE